MTLLEIAFSWVVQGFSVIPIKFKDKTPRSDLRPGGGWNQYKTRLPTLEELSTWCNQQINLALITGWNNLVVIDFDNQDVFDLWHALTSINTYMVKTSRGVHAYFRAQAPVSPMHTEFIDIKAGGGYILIPPSIHPNGHEYKAINNAEILRIDRLEDVLPSLFIPVKQEIKPEYKPVECSTLDPWTRASSSVEITGDVVGKIRQNKKIEDFFPNAERTGNHWLKAICPFHDDKSPSLWIDTSRQLCGCFVCEMKPMDIINLVARLHSISNREAIIYLSQSV
jgi:hypothetical protein